MCERPLHPLTKKPKGFVVSSVVDVVSWAPKVPEIGVSICFKLSMDTFDDIISPALL